MAKISRNEQMNREAKACKLIEALVAVEATMEQVSLMGEEHWKLLAMAAGVKMPSETTRALVVRMFRLIWQSKQAPEKAVLTSIPEANYYHA